MIDLAWRNMVRKGNRGCLEKRKLKCRVEGHTTQVRLRKREGSDYWLPASRLIEKERPSEGEKKKKKKKKAHR